MAEEIDVQSGDPNDVPLSFAEVTAPGATPDGEPQQPAEPPPPPAPPPPQPPPAPQPAAIEPHDALIPSARLREEADARRNAERRAETLQAQIEAMLQRLQPVQPQPPRQRADVFENPSTFVQEEVQPLIEPLNQQLMQVREFYSKRDAMKEFGPQMVNEAFGVMEQGIRSRDPEIHATYNRIMQTMDPYGEMVRWYQQRKTFAEIGGDLNAYNQRVLEHAMKDPNFQAQVIAAARGQAPAVAAAPGSQPRAPNGQFASATAPSSLPSITRVGSTGLHPSEQTDDADDHELFVQTTTGRRKSPT